MPQTLPQPELAPRSTEIDPNVALTCASPILAQTNESLSGLHRLGFVDDEPMRDSDARTLTEPTSVSPEEIKAFRQEQGITQKVLARYLAVSESAVIQWESGAKKPSGPVLKLLAIARRDGLHRIV